MITYQELEAMLEERGVKLMIDGCGCCGGPQVAIWIDDKLIVNKSDFNFPDPDRQGHRWEESDPNFQYQPGNKNRKI